jgi:hypothetical protein
LLGCRTEPAAPAPSATLEEVAGQIPKDAGPIALDAAVFGEPEARASAPLEIGGIDGKRWLGIVESIEDRWGLAHAKDPAVGPDLSVIGGVGGGEIAFGWQSARSWRLALAAKSGEGAYRVVASGELGYAWLDWPAIRPGRREIAVWIVGDGGSRLAQFAERGGVLVDTGPSLLGFEKYWPFWSPDGDLLLTRAVRIRPGGGLDEALLAGDRVVLEGARVGFPTFGASGHEWACAVHRKGGAFVGISSGPEIGPFDDVDRPRATGEGFEFAARRGAALLRVRVGAAGARR